jgi:hypothetical protein
LINISNFAGEEGNRADKARGEGSTENGIWTEQDGETASNGAAARQ